MIPPLYQHQKTAIKASAGKPAFALLMEMRTGKTRVVLEEACRLWRAGTITTLVVVAPLGVHQEWIKQADEFVPFPVEAHAWEGGGTKREQERIRQLANQDGKLVILTVNWDIFTSARGSRLLETFIKDRPGTMLVADEAHKMKTPGAKRTRAMIHLGKIKTVTHRRILTGTLVANTPMDIWAPFQFLDPGILGHPNFYGFRATYAVLKTRQIGGRAFKEIVGYQRQDQLKQKIAAHSFSITAAECLDLPPRQYITRTVDLSIEQKRLYQELSDDLLALYRGQEMTAQLAITQLLRLQQLIGGAFIPDDGEPVQLQGNLPRDAVLLDVLEQAEGPAIVWVRFIAERARLAMMLARAGISVATVSDKATAEQEIKRFRAGAVQVLLANPDGTASEGRDFSMATTMVYYSNSLRLTSRLQSEARCDKRGRAGNTLVVDLVAKGTVDEQIVEALRDKRALSQTFTGEQLMQWVSRETNNGRSTTGAVPTGVQSAGGSA